MILSPVVAIIGAGLHGLCTAIHLRRRGFRVLLVERDSAGRHASGVNAGGVRLLRRHKDEIPVCMEARERWANLDSILGVDLAETCEFVGNVGQISIAETDDDLVRLVARRDFSQSLGWTFEEIIDQKELRKMAPSISPEAIGGLICRSDGHANPYRTCIAFRQKAISLGVELKENCEVLSLTNKHGLWLIETSQGDIEVEVVVNCAGAWGWKMAALAGEFLPNDYYGLSLAITDKAPPFISPVIMGTGRSVTVRQTKAGTVVMGGFVEAKTHYDAGLADPVAGNLRQNAINATALIPKLLRMSVVRTWAGIEARTPDRIPVIGKSSVSETLWHAFGFCAHGFQLAPFVGEALAGAIHGDRSLLSLDSFKAGRFQSNELRFDQTAL